MDKSEYADEKERQSDTATGEASGDWDAEEERRLVRKIDLRCMPVLVILFILNFIDRGNLANARLKGLQTDLKMNDTQYATTLSILFAGYIFMQVPSNLVLNSIPKPRFYMAAVIVLWGLISALTSLCHTFAHMVVCRFFLGFVEAAFYPGSVYYLSRWYTRREVGFRVACLNAGNMLAQGLGGLLAAGILSGLEGAKGIRGWRWLFIIEGCITIFFGLLVPFILADYPATTGWLSDRDRVIAQGRLVKDVGILDNPDESETTSKGVFHGLILAVGDIKVWLMAFMYFSYLIGLSFSQYLPTITKTLGFSTTTTLLMTFPPWAFATIYALFNSWHSDRTNEKFWHVASSYGFALLGYIIALSAKTVAGRYISLFFMCMGFSAGIITIGWVGLVVPRPPVKRAAAIALVNAFANIGQIPASYLWPSKWGPRYWQSFSTEIVLLCFSVSVVFVLRTYLIYLNKKLEKGEAEAFAVSSKVAEQSADLVHVSVQDEKRIVESFRYIY